MNLLYIASIDFYTKPNPSFHLMKSMIEDSLENDIKIMFVGCKEDGLNDHIPENIKNHVNFTYQLIDIPKTCKSNFLKRFIDGVMYSIKVVKFIKKDIYKFKTIFIQSSPTVLFTIFFLKKVSKNSRIIYNVQDMFPGSSIASGIMKNKFLKKFFFSIQKIAYSNSDVIIAISEDMKVKLIEQGVHENKIKVIVNWFDDHMLHEVNWDENRFVYKHSMERDKFYVQYAGTMGYVFDYKKVIDIAQRLQENDNIIFQMIGEGSQKIKFMEETREKNLMNIVFYPLEDQEMVSDVYSACSICLIPLKYGVIGNSVPSKAGLLMACHRPILTTVDENSVYYNMINQNKIGFAFSTKDVEKISNLILELSENVSICKIYGDNGYEYGHVEYSRTENMKKYIALFREGE